MTTYALLSSALFRAPERRMSKAGKPFVTATLKAMDGDCSERHLHRYLSEFGCKSLLGTGAIPPRIAIDQIVNKIVVDIGELPLRIIPEMREVRRWSRKLTDLKKSG